MKFLFTFLAVVAFNAAAGHHTEKHSVSLADAISSELRAESSNRDKFRNPKETLSFFGLKANQTVVELSPGGGWYTEILAPYLRDNGKLIAAHHNIIREIITRDQGSGSIQK